MRDFAYADPYALSLVIDFPDGRTQRWGPDELDAADVPTGLRFGTSMPGGYRDLACSLLRRIDLERYDEQLIATVTVYDNAAEIVWRGRFRQFPRKHGQDYTVEPGAEGWIAHLSDRKDARALYRDVDHSRWQNASLNRLLSQTTWEYVSPENARDPATGLPRIVTALPPSDVQVFSESWYDSHGIPLGDTHWDFSASANINTANASYVWSVTTTPDDAGAVTGATTGDLSTGLTGSGTLTADDDDRFIYLRARFNAAHSLSGTGLVNWTAAVMGAHGLTLRGTEPDAGYYVSDLVRDVVERWAPRLDTTDVDENTVTVTHAAWVESPVEPITMVQTFNRNALWDYGVYGRERFFFRQSNPDRLTWTLRMDLGTEMTFDGPTGDDLINGLVVFFQDPSGRVRSIGPSGSVVDIVDDSLRDMSASNPVNQAGLLKFEALQLSDPVPEDAALLIAQLYLSERSVPQYRGQVVVTGMSAKHPTKGFRPAFEIKAGDHVQIVDSQDDVLGTVRKVVDTDYDHDERANTLDLDNRPDTVDALLSLLGAELVRVGL